MVSIKSIASWSTLEQADRYYIFTCFGGKVFEKENKRKTKAIYPIKKIIIIISPICTYVS